MKFANCARNCRSENEIFKMKNGSVSVVIPCYNHAQYLARCIQSVFDQSYLDVEIILIDDGFQRPMPPGRQRFETPFAL